MAMGVTLLATNSTDLVEEPAMADERAQYDPSPTPLAFAPAPTSPKQGRGSVLHKVGSRIYDRNDRISCHQCLQKTRDFAVPCKKIKKKDKPCCIRFCHTCIRNKYGENALEAYAKENWECPKCKGICNCRVCM